MSWGLNFEEKPNRKTTLAFVLLSCLGMFVIFRGAIWGEAILAPLDIPATLYSKYKWLDPNSGKVPRNHYLIDMFDYDLPRSFLVHRALAQGELPWWEPYSEGGRPLVAEPPFAISDPLKLVVYRICSFVTAYNWTRILQSFLAGVSMFALLRFLGFSQFTTVLGALSFQFSALQAAFYYAVPAHSLFYYPFLWLVLDKYSRTRPALAIGWGGLLCAAIIMAGTQQSHVYLLLFLMCFVVGYGSCFRGDTMRILLVAAGGFLLGCAVAAPFLAAQVELFALSARKVPMEGLGAYLLTGIFSMAGVFPWFTGSFRTLDLGKLLGQQSAAYVIYIGTPALILATIGMLAGKKSPRVGRPETRMAVLLVLVYVVGICSTPLLRVLYLRSSALAVVALPVLFATGYEVMSKNAWPNAGRIVRWFVLFLSIGIVLTHIFAFAVYPRVKDRVLQVVLEKDLHNPSMPSAPELRRSQVNSLPDEITFKNPEPLLAFLGAVTLLGLSSPTPARRRLAAVGIFALNVFPLLMFANRAMPYSSLQHWDALLKGGPEQQKLIKLLGRDLRLEEQVPGRLDLAFPELTTFLYGIHSLHGYSALYLAGPGQMGSERDANVRYVSQPGRADGDVTVLQTNQVRFVWAGKLDRSVTITRETPNSIQLRIGAGPAAELVRTDTYYPGWHVEKPPSIKQRRNSDGFLSFSIPPDAMDLILRYQPSWFGLTKYICIAGLAITAALVAFARRRFDGAEQTRSLHR